MNIVNFEQGSDEWLEWRKGGVTSTDAVVILDRSPYKTIWRLWAEKSGFATPVDISMNPLVRRGNQLEPIAREKFSKYLGEKLTPACVELESDPRYRASLDGITGNGRPAELKCPSEKTWLDVLANKKESEAYKLYVYQVQHALMVTEADMGWLVFYFDNKMIVFDVYPEQETHDEIKLKGENFISDVKNKKEPKKDPLLDLYIPKDNDANDWIVEAEQYRMWYAESQELKLRMDELKQKQNKHLEVMKSMMGEYYHAEFCGVMVTRYKSKGKVNHNKLINDYGISDDTLEQYRGESSERCRVTVTNSVVPKNIVDDAVVESLQHAHKDVELMYF